MLRVIEGVEMTSRNQLDLPDGGVLHGQMDRQTTRRMRFAW
jgi:hypothetical protein